MIEIDSTLPDTKEYKYFAAAPGWYYRGQPVIGWKVLPGHGYAMPVIPGGFLHDYENKSELLSESINTLSKVIGYRLPILDRSL